MWIDILVFYLVPLVLLSVLMPIPDCFQYCSSVVEFEVRDCDASKSSFIVQNCFGYPGFFAFPYKVEYCSFEICEKFCWNFDDNLCWKGCGIRGTLLHCWWECKLVQPLWISVWWFLRKLGNNLPQNPVKSLLGIYPKEKSIITQVHVLIYVHSSIVWNSQNLETT